MSSMIVAPNLARDKDIREDIRKNLVPLQKKVREDRRQYRETWMRYYRIWSRERDQQAYRGRTRMYIPIGRKLIENWTRRLKRDLFPTDDWFQVRALRETFDKKVPAVTALLKYFFTKHMQLRRQIAPWLRQMVMYGTSPVSVGWRLDESKTPVLRQLMDAEGRLTKDWETHIENAVRYIGPTFEPVDLFSWYVWPVTVPDVEDADLVFQDILMPRPKIEEFARKPIHEAAPDLGTVFDPQGVEELLDRFLIGGTVARDKFDAEVRRLADKGFTHPLDQKYPEAVRPMDITRATYKARWEDDDEERLYLVTLGADDVILSVQRNPYWTGVPPWLCGKFVEVENEFYGRGLPEQFDLMQYFVNDIGDQAADALVWSTTPIAMVNAFAVQDPDSLLMRPGAKWMLTAPPGTAVQFTTPPQEPAQMGFQAMGQTLGLMAQLADVAPLGGLGGKSRGRAKDNTAGMQLALQEAMVDIRDVTELNEDLVLNRLLRMTWVLTTQCLDRPLGLRIAGADGTAVFDKVVTLDDITGDYEFAWLGSVGTQNAQVRGAQMLQGIGVITKIPLEMWKAYGEMPDLPFIVREFWKTGLGLPGADRIFKKGQAQTSVDWRLENELFRVNRGTEVIVQEGDDDDDHLQGHQHLIMDVQTTDDMRRAMERHMRAHLAGKIAKQLMAKQKAAMEAAGAQPGGMPGAPPAGGNGNGGGRLKPPVGPGRMASTTDVSDLYRQAPRGGTV